VQVTIFGVEMDAIYLWLATGILLGVVSSLHCAGMCTGISTSILFLSDATAPGDRLGAFALAHLGRSLSYAMIGSLVGAAGAGAIAALPPPLAFRMLQWAAAVAMMWIGLSIAGVLPSLAFADRVLAPLSGTVGSFALRFRSSRVGPFSLGLGWGLMPCAMVYGAYLTAMLTGSAFGGAVTMIGFALGTLPALTISSLGLRSIASTRQRGLRACVGLAIAAVGFSGVYLAPSISEVFCW
jgi:sulfite exporter TauE/SafE